MRLLRKSCAEHKLFLGDSLDYIKSLPDNSIDLIIADPPYDIGKINEGGTVNDIKKFNKSLKALEEAGLISGYDLETFCNEFVRVMKGINIYLWCNKNRYLSI